MRIRILLLLLGIVGEGWAQCPTKLVNGTQDYKGRLQVSSSQGTSMIAEGTSDRILKICKGTTIQVEDVTANNNPSLTAYNFNYQSAEVDLSAPIFDKVNKSYTYAKAGTYGLIMVGSASGTGSYACQTVQVVDTPIPQFDLEVCEAEKVTLVVPKDQEKNPYDEFTVNWGDGNIEQVRQEDLPLKKVHIYKNASANIQVSLQGSYTGVDCKGEEVGKVIDPGKLNDSPTPTITTLVLLNGNFGVNIQFAGPVSGTQEILQKEAGGTYPSSGIQVPGGMNVQTITNLDPKKQYCFQVRSSGGCSSSNTSNEICTVPIAVVDKGDYFEINWPAYPKEAAKFESYTLKVGSKTFTPITDRTTTQIIDKDVICGNYYCYTLETIANGILTVAGNCEGILSGNGKLPDPVDLAYVSIVKNEAVLDWQQPPLPLSYTVSRAELGKGFEEILAGKTMETPFTDKEIDPSQRPYCYQIAYENGCRTWSKPSDAVCTIHLSQKGGDITWTGNTPFTHAIVDYAVQVLDAQGNVIAYKNVGNTTKVNVSSLGLPISPDYEYRIQCTSEIGNTSWSNPIPIRELFQVYVPDAFTPNGDSQNDVFLPKVVHVNALKFTVFDRWGNSIFSTEDESEGWDGYINGKPAPQGSYSYRLDVRNEVGDSFTKRGVFRLIR